MRRYASKIPPFCEEVFWILCPNCKPWHSRRESANFDRGGGFAVGRWSRFGPAQGGSCEVGSRPVPGGGEGTAYPSVVAAFRCLRAQRPGPACPAGSPFSRNGEKEGRGKPLDPRFHGPLVPTRSFWRLWRIVPVVGLFRCPSVP